MSFLLDTPDAPWVMRTYSGHSNAEKSNALYRLNLSKGQTGLSVAFDLPTQTGYDSDDLRARGEVGKVGVPVSHIEDMRMLFQEIPLEKMNTSMTINAPAAWLLALYVAVAQEQGADLSKLQGTTQNDILKEYLSRGTYIFDPKNSMGLITDMVTYCVKELPKFNPINVCPYHLHEAGATPVQELAYGMGIAQAVLDATRATGDIPHSVFEQICGRISFFVDVGLRFITEVCKMRAFGRLWEDMLQNRYGVQEAKYRRFRYGVQVNSLGLTEAQPENNLQRITLEMLGVVMSRDARARAVQLPAWNEALGLPRPWDQQWSLRIMQVMALETDLLEYEDIFNGSTVIEAKVRQLMADAKAEMARVEEMGGMIAAVQSGYVKEQLVKSHAERVRAIEEGRQKVVGVNCYTETAENPLLSGGDMGILKINEEDEREQIKRLQAFRKNRDNAAAKKALDQLKEGVGRGENIMPLSIHAARAGVTTGEWAGALREVFGEWRPPTGIAGAVGKAGGSGLDEARAKVREAGERLGRTVKFLVGKPGLDGHSNGAEQIAVRARDAGMDVVYQGIRLTPEELVNTAVEEGVDVIGLSILSGSHMTLVRDVLALLKQQKLTTPVVVGGIIPPDDQKELLAMGVKRIYTPKDFEINTMMGDIAALAGEVGG